MNPKTEIEPRITRIETDYENLVEVIPKHIWCPFLNPCNPCNPWSKFNESPLQLSDFGMNRLLRLTSLLCALLFALATPAAEPPAKCYLFSNFLKNGEDGLHLAWRADGLKWQALKNGNSFLCQ